MITRFSKYLTKEGSFSPQEPRKHNPLISSGRTQQHVVDIVGTHAGITAGLSGLGNDECHRYYLDYRRPIRPVKPMHDWVPPLHILMCERDKWWANGPSHIEFM